MCICIRMRMRTLPACVPACSQAPSTGLIEDMTGLAFIGAWEVLGTKYLMHTFSMAILATAVYPNTFTGSGMFPARAGQGRRGRAGGLARWLLS